MNYAVVIEALALVVPLLITISKDLFKGNKKWVIAIAAFFILKKWAGAAAEAKARGDLQDSGGNNPNALAVLFKQAMNPSGYDFLIEMDGTNEDLLFQLAAETRNYKAVYDAYQIAFKRDLTRDLQQELSSDDLRKFLNILNQ